MISSISNYVPNPNQMASNIVNNLSKISSVVLPLIAMAAIPVSNGGIITATACFVACEAFLATLAPPAAVAYAPTCFAGCKIALASPTP